VTSDPSLKKYESSQDTVGPTWSVERSGEGICAQLAFPLKFTLSRPVSDVWKYMKDFNLWLEDLHYNCVVGEASEGQTIFFTINEKAHEHYRKTYGFDPSTFKKHLIVRRSEPATLMVWDELSQDKRTLIAYYMWALSEREGKTTVSGLMGYAPHWGANDSEEQLRNAYRTIAFDVAERWRTAYIPRLRQLVANSP
jgi:hypothetical protein